MPITPSEDLRGQDNVMSYQVPCKMVQAQFSMLRPDHAATWGIVLRLIQPGQNGAKNIITYGEGDSFLQRAFDPKNNNPESVDPERGRNHKESPAAMKTLAITSLLASFALFLAQIFLYTNNQEVLVYGVFGALWYMAMYFNTFRAQARGGTRGHHHYFRLGGFWPGVRSASPKTWCGV